LRIECSKKEEYIMQITIREPGSAITHFIAMMMAVFATVPLLVKAGIQSGWENFLAMAIFMGSMILLYGASATYHSVDLTGRSLRVFRKLDHMMIFVLIAGSYTPVCLIVLGGKLGYTLLALVWGIAAVGMLVKACWITCPKWFSSVIYIAMGWVCVLVFGPLLKTLSAPAFLWLLAGGIIYTVGGVIYALKLPIFNAKHKFFGSHEVFHLFVMGGSICHFIFMYLYVA
jgi:hemolysin III